jgi:DUF971 family protein
MTPPLPLPVPHAINRQDNGVRIEWDRAGHEGFYPAYELRLACPCAACVEEMTGQQLIDPAKVDPGVRPLSLALVGAYGLRVHWSDGHATGIYTFKHLLNVCPCPSCRMSRQRGGP